MNVDRFDTSVHALICAPSRRDIVRGLAGAGLGLSAFWFPDATEAKKHKHQGKKPKLKRNEFGCVNVGQACRGKDANCCSGLCEGKKPKRGKKDTSHCVAHDTAGVCSADTDVCTGQVVLCNADPNVQCNCALTTGNAGFCLGAPGQCRVCSKDTDCQAEFGPGAACIVLSRGICSASCPDTNGTACAPACA